MRPIASQRGSRLEGEAATRPPLASISVSLFGGDPRVRGIGRCGIPAAAEELAGCVRVTIHSLAMCDAALSHEWLTGGGKSGPPTAGQPLSADRRTGPGSVAVIPFRAKTRRKTRSVQTFTSLCCECDSAQPLLSRCSKWHKCTTEQMDKSGR